MTHAFLCTRLAEARAILADPQSHDSIRQLATRVINKWGSLFENV